MILVALLPSLFVLSMSSHPLLHLYYTSIFREFDEDGGNISGAAWLWRLDS